MHTHSAASPVGGVARASSARRLVALSLSSTLAVTLLVTTPAAAMSGPSSPTAGTSIEPAPTPSPEPEPASAPADAAGLTAEGAPADGTTRAATQRRSAIGVVSAIGEAPLEVLPTTVTGWEGERIVSTGFAPSRVVTITPSQGRSVKLQRHTSSGWKTIQTLTAPEGDTAQMRIQVPAVTTETTVRYRLALPATLTAERAYTWSWDVTYGKKPTTLEGWPAATTPTVWGTSKSRTITAPAGRGVVLQQLSGSTWTTVRSYVVPIDGQLTVTIPTVSTTRPISYRVRVNETSTHKAAISPTWIIKPVAPPMPAQRYNGEVPGVVGAWAGYRNGEIPTSIMCSPSWTSTTHKTRCDADAALEAMNAAYRAEFGVNMSITSTYRTYAQQVSLKKQKPTLAATPGTSNHGWGLAIDFGGGIQVWGSPQHNWMRANANDYGWFHPTWAQFEGSLPEPWHWEYAGTVASGSRDHSRALARELVRTESWNTASQRRCLADLWEIQSGWDYQASKSSGDRRGIPQASMRSTFGSSWTTSSSATAYLRNPKTQIEWGLRNITATHGNACRALDAHRAADPVAPALAVRALGPTTVAPGATTRVEITYTKGGEPVPSATVVLQKLMSGQWRDVGTATVTDGVAVRNVTPGAATASYRIRNHNTSAVSPTFVVTVAG